MSMLLSTIDPSMIDPSAINRLKLIQALGTVALFVLPAMVVAWRLSRHIVGRYSTTKKMRMWWHLDRMPSLGTTLAWIGLIVLASPAVNMLSDLNQQIHLPWPELEHYFRAKENEASTFTQLFLIPLAPSDLVVNLLLMAILPAFAEEIFFRGTLLRYNKHVAVWTVAILFSAAHMQMYGFIPRTLLGAMMGYAYIWTGSLWMPMLMHATNNTVAVLSFHIAYRMGEDPMAMAHPGGEGSYWLGVVSFMLTIGGVIYMRICSLRKS